MTGQVLDISKYDVNVRTERPARPAAEKRTARLYRFPSHTPEPATQSNAAPTPQPHRALGTWRSRLAIEFSIGFMMWLIWFWWHLLH